MFMNSRKVYGKRQEEEYLHIFAQHNEHCRKIWGLTEVMQERGEFQRDRERIVNSRAFRRMVDKAQIFTSAKGDHYRSRMTHTLEVAQIARSIANSLRLNIDLTEAIALGHDIGHTPFGHQGERTLQDILNHRIQAGLPEVKGQNIYGGFKHNFQGVRVLNCLEEKYIPYEGLDISYQVLEGILKHTGYRQKECTGCERAEKGCPRECCDLKVFLGNGDMGELYTQFPFPTTLEGQAVAIADEIAQRSHDVDDAMSAGLLNYEQLLRFLQQENADPLLKLIQNSYRKIQESDRDFISRDQIICARLISDIVNYFVNDVVAETIKKMDSFKEDDLYRDRHRFSSGLVGFSESGSRICALLENMVKRKVINNPEIAKFDYNADIIVRGLFQIYYHNPRLLHVGTLRKLGIEIKNETGEDIDFADGEPGEIRKILQTMAPGGGKCAFSDNDWKKHVILVRAITDYIAGMTDSYARDEYASFCCNGQFMNYT